MIVRKLFASLLMALVAFVAVGSAFAVEPIRIGVCEPLTGVSRLGGQAELAGLELAQKQLPELLGRPVELVVMDNKSDPAEATKTLARLVGQHKLSALVASYDSDLAHAAFEVAEEANIPCVVPFTPGIGLPRNRQYTFRLCPGVSYQVAGAAHYAVRTRGFRKAAMLVDYTFQDSNTLARFFGYSFKSLGGEIVAKLHYQAGERDFEEALTEIIAREPDILYLPAQMAEALPIIQQARELGGRFVILGTDCMDFPDMLKEHGSIVEGLLFTHTAYDVSAPEKTLPVRAFTELWKREHPGSLPSSAAAFGYTAYMALAHVIESKGSTAPEDIAEGLATLSDFPTLFGNITMDDEYNPVGYGIGLSEVKQGKRIYLGSVEMDL